MNIFNTKDVSKVDHTTSEVVESALDYTEARKNDGRMPSCRTEKDMSVKNLAPVNRGHHY